MAQCLRDEDGGCRRCDGELNFDFTMAFQPIVDLEARDILAFEALVRGAGGESAYQVLSQVEPRTTYRFDQACRIRALEIAYRLGCDRSISINFLPNAVYEPHACIEATLKVADKLGWPAAHIWFEVTETELVKDRLHLQNIVDSYREIGFKTALDDFGAGYANLDLLIDLKPDFVKIDRQMVDGVDKNPRQQVIVDNTATMLHELGIRPIAEGVETRAEAQWLFDLGITLQQGYYFARPVVETLPEVTLDFERTRR